jgi:HAD superfamily phosphatase (TIGR01668 family)
MRANVPVCPIEKDERYPAMKHLLRPDHIFQRLADVTPEALRACGIRALLCDLDNTLVAPHTRHPTKAAIAWLKSMRAGGITVMLVSNNTPRRVREFCRKLPFEGQALARKPLPFGLNRAWKKMGTAPNETGFLGDQLFTDVLGARLAGIQALYVYPMIEERGWFFRLKRKLEKPFLREKHTGKKPALGHETP